MSFRSSTISLLACLLLVACNQVQVRMDSAERLATGHGFEKSILQTSLFKIVSYQSITSANTVATFYIEGDGLAWSNRTHVSPNPTPKNPVALRLALIDPSENVIYLARPCQYIDLDTEQHCHPDYWTMKRIAPEVIASLDEAITKIKQRARLNKIRLVGYSGGGAIAAILAAKRSDVIDFRTVAGNLDIEMFSRHHKVSPLSGSLNPIDFAESLSKIPQIHFIGEIDEVVTPSITESYLNHLRQYDDLLKCVEVKQFKNVSHAKGWQSVWQTHAEISTGCF